MNEVTFGTLVMGQDSKRELNEESVAFDEEHIPKFDNIME